MCPLSCTPAKLIERTPPLRGGFVFTMFLIKNREEEDPPWRTTPKNDQFLGWFFRGGGPFPPGSWSGNIVNRTPPPGGGGSFDQLGNTLFSRNVAMTQSALVEHIGFICNWANRTRHEWLQYRVVLAHRNHFFDPARKLVSTYWWSQNPAC